MKLTSSTRMRARGPVGASRVDLRPRFAAAYAGLRSPRWTKTKVVSTSLEHGEDPLRDAVFADRCVRSAVNLENFPVAMRVLPKAMRRDLHAVYAVVRWIDYLGDVAPGDRVAALNDFRTDLHQIWCGGTPSRPMLQALAPTVRAHGLAVELFDRQIEASLVDQRVSRYSTFDDLVGHCRLSVEPVGRLVLDIFGQSSADLVELSDRVCRALQLFEHWQDAAEDRRAGRVYLPQEDLAAYGVPETDLDRPYASDALRTLMLFETDRAARLLESGAPIVGRLTGWAKVAVAGYVAGGRAAARALHRTGGDVLGRAATARDRDVAFAAADLLLHTSRGRTDR